MEPTYYIPTMFQASFIYRFYLLINHKMSELEGVSGTITPVVFKLALCDELFFPK